MAGGSFPRGGAAFFGEAGGTGLGGKGTVSPTGFVGSAGPSPPGIAIRDPGPPRADGPAGAWAGFGGAAAGATGGEGGPTGPAPAGGLRPRARPRPGPG